MWPTRTCFEYRNRGRRNVRRTVGDAIRWSATGLLPQPGLAVRQSIIQQTKRATVRAREESQPRMNKFIFTALVGQTGLGLWLAIVSSSSRPVIYLQTLGLWPVFALLFLGSLGFYMRSSPRWPSTSLFAGLLYFTSHALVSLAIGEPLFDVTGSFARATLPFLVALSLYALMQRRRAAIYEINAALWWAAIVGASAKWVAYLATGAFYGGGVHQFSISAYLLVVVLSSVIWGAQLGLPRSVSLRLVGLWFLVASTVLSFKRGAWVSLAAAVVLFALWAWVQRGLGRLLGILSATLAVSTLVATGFGVLEGLERRWQSIEVVADSTRADEWDRVLGAYATANATNVIVGFGTSAELPGGTDSFRNVSLSGRALHIHSFYALVLFRFGLLGMLCFVMPALMLATRLRRHGRGLSAKDRVVPIGVALWMFQTFVVGVSSNAAYGSIGFGIALAAGGLWLYRSETLARKP